MIFWIQTGATGYADLLPERTEGLLTRDQLESQFHPSQRLKVFEAQLNARNGGFNSHSSESKLK
jgi:hypothetical protein